MFVRQQNDHDETRQRIVISSHRRLGRRARQGQSLVEFALVALVVYMLLAAILTFGHMLFVAQGLQAAADFGAREISRTPLPATMTFDEALGDDDVRSRIFDEAWLVVNLTDFYANFVPPLDEETSVFGHLVPQMPLLNRQLAPLMIVDQIDLDGDGETEQILRYPGALLARDPAISPPSGMTYPSWVATHVMVSIPLVVARDADGVETDINWVPVVEEIEPPDVNDARRDPFSLASEIGGVVALRINYPFQSASMSGFRPRPPIGEPGDTDLGRPNLANESEDVVRGTYAGANGLGVQQAFGQRVRPFRRVISAQAIYRREVFTQ